MTILHSPPLAELTNESQVSLAGITPDRAIDLSTSVQAYGQDIAQDLSAPDEYARRVEAVAVGVMRASITGSIRTRAVSYTAEEVEAIRSARYLDTIPPAKENLILEEVEYSRACPESYLVSEGELSFMARCLLRKLHAADDCYVKAQSEMTISWLQQNPATRETVDRVTNPASIGLRELKYAGRLAVSLFSPGRVSRPRHAR